MTNLAFQQLEPVLVISPHLDDGVFGCGELLAMLPGTTVATLFAGTPPDAGVHTEWDEACGFDTAGEALDARRSEDRDALALLGANPVHLPFLDGQYAPSPRADTLAAALDELIEARRPHTVLMPLGLFHTDHHLVHAACLLVMRRHLELQWLAYEDALYRRIDGTLQSRLAALLAAGVAASPCFFDGVDAVTQARRSKRKAMAVATYASQLQAFGPDGLADTDAPERYWHLHEMADNDAA